MRKPGKKLLIPFVILLLFFQAKVAGQEIIATTSFLQDIAQNVAGKTHPVSSLMPIGGDPHIYEPVPEDARKVSDAGLIIKNGLYLEGWLNELIENSGTEAIIIEAAIGCKVIKSVEFHGSPDPHAWMDVTNAIIYAENIFNALTLFDSDNESIFRKNFLQYKEQLEQLDQEVFDLIKTLPENNRILITSHDAFQYYGRRYGLRLESVLGTSTDADVQITDINNLVAVIDKFSVPAMFVESTINPKLLEQLAEDRGIIIGGKLFADSLGDEESGADTYIDMIRQNTKRLVLGLSGKARNQTTAKTELWIFLIVIVLLFAVSFIVVATKLKTPQNKMGNRRDYSLTIEGLSVSYDRKTVLTNIYLNLQPGKIYGLIGPNGAGKSTLFKAILNLISIDAGKIEVNGHSLDSLRKYIAYIPQKEEIDWQFPATVSDIVSMGRYPHKDTFERLSNDDWKIVEEMMEKTGITELRYRQIGELSGGQQQRVFLARALSQHAEIYLFDEPFVGVDATTETKMMEILRDLASEGKLILVIHHDLSKVEEYFDSVIMLNQRLVAFGPVAETFTDEIIKKTYSGKLTILQHMEEIV